MIKNFKEQETSDAYGEFLFRSISVSKYNPKYYTSEGYSHKEWIDYSDINNIFNGKKLLLSEYIEMEYKYILACYAFLNMYKPESTHFSIEKVESVIMDSFDKENENGLRYLAQLIRKGFTEFSLLDLGNLVQLVLRNHVWFVINIEDTHKIHFGWDYYMYFENDRVKLLNDKKLCKKIRDIGLFIR